MQNCKIIFHFLLHFFLFSSKTVYICKKKTKIERMYMLTRWYECCWVVTWAHDIFNCITLYIKFPNSIYLFGRSFDNIFVWRFVAKHCSLRSLFWNNIEIRLKQKKKKTYIHTYSLSKKSLHIENIKKNLKKCIDF